MTKYVEMTSELREATKNPAASDRFMRALEEHEADRKAEYDKLFMQMRQDHAGLRHAIYWAAAFLGLMMTVLGIAVPFAIALFGDG